MKKNTLIICIVAAVLVVGLVIGLILVLGGNKAPETPNTPETPADKTYTLALAVENSVGDDNKVTNYVVALLLDDAGKIVAARLDCVETTPSVVDGAIADVASILSKVAQGENYGGTAVPEYMQMGKGSFAKQTKAFEDAIVGKTAAEVEAFDTTLVAGCTMPYSPFSFKSVIAKAFASTNKTTFKTAETVTLGVAADMSVAEGKVTTYYAATAVVGGKIAANIIDCNELSFTVVDGAAVAGEYAGTKVEQGENYGGTAVPEYMQMGKGSFAKQTEAFENAIVGKTAAEVEAFDTTLVAGCTMPYSPASFKVVVAGAIANAR